jgi:ribosome-associated heat shock protein Hsp15
LSAAAQRPELGNERQRIDKWLWHARIVRTRSDAARLVGAGHTRVNGQRVTEVAGFCERRGSPRDAVVTYRSLEPGA